MAVPSRPQGQHSVSARPRPDESLIGYIFRLAARRFTSARGLAEDCGFNRLTNRPEPAWLAALAETSGMPQADLHAISYGIPNDAVGWFRGHELGSNAFDRRGGVDRRVCPRCLEEADHHRAIWDLLFVAACPIHKVRLADCCRTCGEPLRWLEGRLLVCGCGAILRRMQAEALSDADLRGTRAVYGLLGDSNFAAEAAHVQGFEPFRDLAPGKVVEFLFRIGLELVAPRSKVFSMDQTGELAWEAHVALSRGLALAEAWPGAFLETLAIMKERAAGTPGFGLRQSVGPVERWLDRLPPGSGTAIREACAEFRSLVTAQKKKSVQRMESVSKQAENAE